MSQRHAAHRFGLGVILGAVAVAVAVALGSPRHAGAQDKAPAAAESETKPPITLRGKVTKMDWSNPHASIFLDVPDEIGNLTKWKIEAAAPDTLIRRGWSKDLLRPGTEITVSGFLPKNSNKLVTGYALKVGDGKTWIIGPSDPAVPTAVQPAEDPCTVNPNLPVCLK